MNLMILVPIPHNDSLLNGAINNFFSVLIAVTALANHEIISDISRTNIQTKMSHNFCLFNNCSHTFYGRLFILNKNTKTKKKNVPTS